MGIDRNALYRLEQGKPIKQASYARVLGWLLS